MFAYVLGVFKLDHLQSVKLILFPNISTFLPFILGGPISYYPRERRQGSSRGWKEENGIHSKVTETQGFLYLEHSNWTICSLLIWFCYKFFPTSWSLYWGAHFLLPQRAEDAEKGFTQTTSFYLYGYLPKYFCKLTINLWKRLVLLHVWIMDGARATPPCNLNVHRCRYLSTLQSL